MVQNLGTNKILWLLTALLSLAAALVGVFNPDIYSDLPHKIDSVIIWEHFSPDHNIH